MSDPLRNLTIGVVFASFGAFFAAAMTFGSGDWVCCPDGRTVVLVPPSLLSGTVLLLCTCALVQFLRDRAGSGLVALAGTPLVMLPLGVWGAVLYLVLTLLTAVLGVGRPRTRRPPL